MSTLRLPVFVPNPPARPARRRVCKCCGQPERRTNIGGYEFTTIARYSSICADCINNFPSRP
jgi:hypothetical protein